jgi:hypothetical protein
LLGDLSEPEHERLEQEYFVNDELLDMLDAVENDLIDSYVRGELPPHEHARVENYLLLIPGKRRRVELARILMIVARNEQGKSSPAKSWNPSSWFPWGRMLAIRVATVTAATVILAMAALLAVQNHRLRTEISSAQLKRQKQVHDLEEKLAQLTGKQDRGAKSGATLPSPQIPTIYITLTPGLVRGAGGTRPVLRLPASPASVVFVLKLDNDDYSQYSAEVQTVEGKRIYAVNELVGQLAENGNKAVAVTLPVRNLGNDDYIIKLFGQIAGDKKELLHPYNFSVRR